VPRALTTVVETAGFIASSAGLLSEDERAGVVEMLARDPECGDVIPGTEACGRSAYGSPDAGRVAALA
jgi:hypothetical protein